MSVTSILTNSFENQMGPNDLIQAYSHNETLVEVKYPQGLQLSIVRYHTDTYLVKVGDNIFPAVSDFLATALDDRDLIDKLPVGTTYWIVAPKHRPQFETAEAGAESVLRSILTDTPENVSESHDIMAIGIVTADEKMDGVVENFRLLHSYGLPIPEYRHYPTLKNIDMSSKNLYMNPVETYGYQSKKIVRKVTLKDID